jgi:hypothetical protein
VWRCEALGLMPWLDHGFGSRHSPDWLAGRRVAALQQTHSDVVRDAAGHGGWLGEGDGLISREPGLMVAVRTADCFPVVIADPARQAVAVVHAGWRGVVAGIVVRAAEQLLRAGLARENIHQSGLCSYCRAEEFWSFRREGGAAGRMWSAAGVRKA